MYYPYVHPFPLPHRHPIPEQYENNNRSIIVIGQASISVQPDIATVQLAVVTTNEELMIAEQSNAETMNRVIRKLEELSILKDEIQTTSFQIWPRYDYIDGKQIFRGYEVTNELTITIKEMDQIGQIIDTAVKSGVNRVTNIQFLYENSEQVYKQALQQAIQNATEKARAITEELGDSFIPVPIKVIEERESNDSPKVLGISTENVSTPIEIGTIKINAAVRMIFKF